MTYNSANASSCSSRNGREEGRRAILSQCQKGNGGNEILRVSKHPDSCALKNLLLSILMMERWERMLE